MDAFLGLVVLAFPLLVSAGGSSSDNSLAHNVSSVFVCNNYILHYFHAPTLPSTTTTLATTPAERADQSTENCGGKSADVYFLIDSSSSITGSDFHKELQFVRDVVDIFDIGPHKTRVGIITFSHYADHYLTLDNGLTKPDLVNKIGQVRKIAGVTNTADALRMMRQDGFAHGIARPDVAKIAVVLTDGLSVDERQTADEARIAHKLGIKVFAIGIGNWVDLVEIQSIASDPHDDYVFQVTDFASLDAIKEALAIKTCGVKPEELKQNDPPVCYPNGTIIVTNPNSGTYTNVVAVEDTGSGSAADCSVSVSGSTVEITNCALDQDIVIHFSDRASTSGGDSIFGGDSVDSYTIHCAQISDSGVDRTVDDSLAATLETSTEAEVTPSFAISTELRGIASLTSAEVTQADVGDSIYWTLDVPSDYNARPSCTAYSGTDNSGISKTLFTNGCADDDDLVSDDFTSVSSIVPLINRYYVTLYVFKFYDSDDVYFHCTVKVCPSSGIANCLASCTKKRRSIDNSTLEAGERYFESNRVLHILPAGSGATALPGSVWLIVTSLLISNK